MDKNILTREQISKMYENRKLGIHPTSKQYDDLFKTALYWERQYMGILSELVNAKAEIIFLNRQVEGK